MSYSGLTLVTDAELGQLEPEAVNSAAPWGATTWSSQRTEAKRDLKIWLEADFPDVVGVADRIVDTWRPDYAFALTGGSYTDITNEVSNDTEDDINLATIFTTVGTDRIYIGAAWEFEALAVLLTDVANANASILSVKYSGPATGAGGPANWPALTVTDGTAASGKTFGKSGRITWTTPTDWQRERLNGTGDEYYWIELTVSATLTAGAKASQLLPVRAPDGLKRVAGYLALHHIYNGLAAASADVQVWQAKADQYFTKARELYGMLKANAALWLDINRTNEVQQEERVSRPITLGRA